MIEKEIAILCLLILMSFEMFFDDEDSSYNMQIENIIMFLKYRINKNPILRLQNYVEEVLPSYTDLQFKSHFR